MLQHWFSFKRRKNMTPSYSSWLSRWAHSCVMMTAILLIHFFSLLWTMIPQAYVVVGGMETSEPLDSVLTLLPGASSWTILVALPTLLTGARASIVGGNLRLVEIFNWVEFQMTQSRVAEVGSPSVWAKMPTKVFVRRNDAHLLFSRQIRRFWP